MLTTEIGVAIANALPSKWLLLSFAALQITAIWLINLKKQLQKEEKEIKIDFSESPGNSTAPLLKTQGIGLIAGVLSGLFGVGGGIRMFPCKFCFLKCPLKNLYKQATELLY